MVIRRSRVSLLRPALHAAAAVLVLTPVHAHHAASNHAASGTPVMWHGTLLDVSWDGPHVMYRVAIASADGARVSWQVLGASPQRLLKRGVRYTSLKEGEQVAVAGYLDAYSRIISPVYVASATGQKFFVGYFQDDRQFRPGPAPP